MDFKSDNGLIFIWYNPDKISLIAFRVSGVATYNINALVGSVIDAVTLSYTDPYFRLTNNASHSTALRCLYIGNTVKIIF